MLHTLVSNFDQALDLLLSLDRRLHSPSDVFPLS